MTRRWYTLALYVLLPIILLRLWWRGRAEPGYRRAVAERFGRYGETAADSAPLVWVHAVSVGEARASAGLVRALCEPARGLRVLVTCTTAAGRETLEGLHGDAVRIVWLPYDAPAFVQRFLDHFRPRLAVLMETEIWPNLLAGCRDAGVPALLANARMSEKSAAGYRRWRRLMEPALRSLSAVCAQSQADADRLAALGASSVSVAGNVKFDNAPDEVRRAQGRAWRQRLGRPVLLLASTREGEERALLEALPAWDESLLVVLVPRHARRFDELSVLAQSRRSRTPDPQPQDRVHLGDTMGEMDFYYAAADVAVIGGSFAPLGGQNLIEACAAGVPVIFGPSMFNFAEAAALALGAGAALQSPDARQAIGRALELIGNEAERRRMGEAGRRLCEIHRGATARHLAVCDALLEPNARVRARG